MLRRYRIRRPYWVIRVTFASGAVTLYGPFETAHEAEGLLATRWATDPAPDPRARHADVTSAEVLRKRVPRPMRPAVDLIGRRFVQV